jgi:predicted anti-sigma-YlaC factor YlaD
MRGASCRAAGGRGTAHLFLCRMCRADARLKAALRRLPSPAARESPLPVSEDFLQRVAASVREQRGRHARRRTLLSLAAALLFFFLAGAGQETGSNDTLRIEDAAQLLAPSALESLMPD